MKKTSPVSKEAKPPRKRGPGEIKHNLANRQRRLTRKMNTKEGLSTIQLARLKDLGGPC